MPLFVVECKDVKALSNSQINLLRCGDYLVKKDASGEHAYKVTFKKEGVGMCLTYMDASVIETQSYDYVDGEWVYNSEDKTPNLLELPTNANVVHKIPAPTSTTLTDEQIEMIKGGVFIDGTFLSKTNPVFFPPRVITATNLRGFFIGDLVLGEYMIDLSTKVITTLNNTTRNLNFDNLDTLNGKQIPNYPANTGTYVLKSVDGVLTWVEEV